VPAGAKNPGTFRSAMAVRVCTRGRASVCGRHRSDRGVRALGQPRSEPPGSIAAAPASR